MSRRPPPAPAGKRLDAVLAAGIEQKFVVQGDAPAPQRLPALTATECGAYTPMDADAVPEADQTGLYMVAGLYVFDSMKTPLYAGLQAMMARNRMLDVSKNTVYDMLMTAIRQAYVYDSRQTKPDATDPRQGGIGAIPKPNHKPGSTPSTAKKAGSTSSMGLWTITRRIRRSRSWPTAARWRTATTTNTSWKSPSTATLTTATAHLWKR